MIRETLNPGYLFWGSVLMGIGFYILYRGIKLRRICTEIKEHPVSQIADVTLGEYVALEGKIVAENNELVVAPITGRKCAAFHWKVIYVPNGKIPYWRTVADFYSTPKIYIKDESREVAAIDLSVCMWEDGALNKEKDFVYESQLSNAAQLLLAYHDIQIEAEKMVNEFDRSGYKIRETVFLPNQGIYALGTSHPLNHPVPPAIEIHLSSWERVRRKIEEGGDKEQILKQYKMESFVPTDSYASFLLSGSEEEGEGMKKVYLDFARKHKILGTRKVQIIIYIVSSVLIISWSLYVFSLHLSSPR